MNPNRHTKALPYQRRISFQSALGQPTYNIHTRGPIHPLEIFSGEGEVIIHTTN
jgi:hypothetical protein